MDEVEVQYRDLSFWGMVPKTTIPTVGSTFKHMIFGSGPKHRTDILKGLTGRIRPGKMTLLMGPPGCGKSSLLKALAGQLAVGNKTLDGDLTYNGVKSSDGKFVLPKLTDYIDEKDQHAATLTVLETLEFAWRMSSNSKHSYSFAKDAEAAAIMDKDNEKLTKVSNRLSLYAYHLVHNFMKILGISNCADTVVGDGMLRGISGGQKRRVSVAEMMLPPRPLKFMDAVSNGLDAATTFQIFQAIRLFTDLIGVTTCVSLLQPSPEVFNLFDDLILMSEGQIVYQGPVQDVLPYFESLGFVCPVHIDVADFLQELPTAEGRRFITDAKKDTCPRGTSALVEAFKDSSTFKEMVVAMDESILKYKNYQWHHHVIETYAAPWFESVRLCLERQKKLTVRDTAFLKGRGMQAVIIASITGSLFNNVEETDVNTMGGVLFFSVLFCALASMAMLPIIFEQRNIFYKHSKAMFFPTSAFVISQTLVFLPVQILEAVIFSIITYWSVGLSDDDNGGRFLVFILCVLSFSLCATQLFRLVASFTPNPVTAQPLAGLLVVLMVLFSGYIIPKSNIPDGWIWFYWINPIAWVLKGVTVNEYLASDYDFMTCTNADCSVQERFGDVALEQRGNPTEQAWVWYAIIVVLGEYLILIALTALTLTYLRVEPSPPPPIIVDDDEVNEDKAEAEKGVIELPFDPVTFAFKDIWYTVTLKGGEELDLLKGVSGYFEPGTLTALMGTSGAGKTTLLDVLSGRKNTGVVEGQMTVNGKPKDDHEFRHAMGYVEQFDTLCPQDTAREAIEFSAALRLPRETTVEARREWVTAVLTMLELTPLENTMVGSETEGGMSFEQKKRLSIGVELAANPAILFLDGNNYVVVVSKLVPTDPLCFVEPTTGLDSRSAQVVIRCIRRVAASGRSIVCTIHQPSISIFEEFDSLLLLRRGGETVFNGSLGENCDELIQHFCAAPGVTPPDAHINPATWMLDVVGSGAITDFHAYYKQSVDVLSDCSGSDHDIIVDHRPFLCGSTDAVDKVQQHTYNAPYKLQFQQLMYRIHLSYWRSPSYNFIRMMISAIVALLFSSTYASQKYDDDVDTISRCAVIYITLLFCGVIGMMSVQPVIFAERPAFYREQHAEMYDVRIYTIANALVEVPYLIASSVIFTIIFFFIVGFDKDGVAAKFFWYWCFQALYMATLVFIGHFVCAAFPTPATAQVISGMISTVISIFAGFMIRADDFPSFWTFVYWLDPLHYALEGLFTTQFNKDDTVITLFDGQTTTAEAYVEDSFDGWDYSHRIGDAVALLIIIVALRVGTFLCLKYLRHDKR
ncbi:unnamed protein product [Ectocarpus fasciculatus]